MAQHGYSVRRSRSPRLHILAASHMQLQHLHYYQVCRQKCLSTSNFHIVLHTIPSVYYQNVKASITFYSHGSPDFLTISERVDRSVHNNMCWSKYISDFSSMILCMQDFSIQIEFKLY